jgi:hypothetical protein
VNHKTTLQFWACYRKLPVDVQRLADKCFELLKGDPQHPSLQFKRVGAYWSVRVGLHYRAVSIGRGSEIVWFWIGSHAEYDRLLGR